MSQYLPWLCHISMEEPRQEIVQPLNNLSLLEAFCLRASFRVCRSTTFLFSQSIIWFRVWQIHPLKISSAHLGRTRNMPLFCNNNSRFLFIVWYNNCFYFVPSHLLDSGFCPVLLPSLSSCQRNSATTSGTPTRYIVGIYHVYTMYIPTIDIEILISWIYGQVNAVSQSNDWGESNVEARND